MSDDWIIWFGLFRFCNRSVHDYSRQIRIDVTECGNGDFVITDTAQERIDISVHGLYGIDIMVHSLAGVTCKKAQVACIDIVVGARGSRCKERSGVFDTPFIVPSEKRAPCLCAHGFLASRAIELGLEQILQRLVITVKLHERQPYIESKADIIRLILSQTQIIS